MKGGNPAGQLTNQIAAICQSGGSYRLVRVLRRDGRWHAVFRMILPSQGMNYHDIRLTSSNGKVVGDRLFVAINSEEMADTMRALAQPAMKNRNLVGRLSGQQQAAETAFDNTIALLTAVKTGQFQEVIRLYDQLPEASRANKSVMLGMITAQSQLDEAEYLAAIDRYREAFPNDPSLGLVLLDAALMREDWELLEVSRQKLNAWTGGDPYVDLLIATIFSQDPAKVQQALEMTKDVDPRTLGLPAAHYNKLTIALSGKDFRTVVQQMDALLEEYGVEFEEEAIRSEPLFAEFVESPEFQDWLSR
jgi:tetratricopeptide (TPR) repeat protein